MDRLTPFKLDSLPGKRTRTHLERKVHILNTVLAPAPAPQKANPIHHLIILTSTEVYGSSGQCWQKGAPV